MFTNSMKTQSILAQTFFTTSLSLAMSVSEFIAKPVLMIEYQPTFPEEIEEVLSTTSHLEIEETKKVSDLIKTFEHKYTSSSSNIINKK